MPIFKSEAEAIEAHKAYEYDTDHEGKFSPRHIGWLRSKQLLDWFPDNQPVFLGVGCNTGGFERLIMRHKKGSVAYGVDVCEPAIAVAHQKGILASVNKAEELPFEPEKFDVVILSEVLEHLFDPKKAFKEAVRVTKKGGLIIGSVPHPESFCTKKRPLEEHIYHTHTFTHDTLKDLFNGFNAELVDIPFCHSDVVGPQWIMFKIVK